MVWESGASAEASPFFTSVRSVEAASSAEPGTAMPERFAPGSGVAIGARMLVFVRWSGGSARCAWVGIAWLNALAKESMSGQRPSAGLRQARCSTASRSG